MANISSERGNILFIDDPNAVNINQDLPNAIGQYQDMHIFAELLAVRKGRSVIVSGHGIQKTGLEDTIEINFLGNNQNKNNPNYLNFTTNYYDGSTQENETQYESFGISSIKVVVNSSFVPQINVQFVDVRGLSFFNQKNSPYRILFDFPPPIFNLKIKGYYGRTLEYQLHLVKYTTEFKSENGNFVIDAQFVAITFAPLTDVLFRYVINFPLMLTNVVSMNPEPNVPPANTNELILKLKSLYSVINEQVKTDVDSKKYDNTLTQLENNRIATSALLNFKDALQDKGQPFIFINNASAGKLPLSVNTNNASNFVDNMLDMAKNPPSISSETDSVITPLANLFEYDTQIQALSVDTIPSKINERLYIGFIVNPANLTTQYNALNAYRTQLLKGTAQAGTKGSIVDSDISTPKYLYNSYNISTKARNVNLDTKYCVIDVTNFYFKLYKQKIDIQETKNETAKVINEKINNMIEQKLGMRPTIYNIFKVILDDVDTFYDMIRKTSEDAERHHNLPDFNSIIASGGLRDSGENKNEYIYAFPLIINQEKEGCADREVRVSPVEINKKLSTPFPETDLVKNFIDTFTKQRQQAILANMRAELNDDGTNKWIPISPIDSTLSGTDPSTPYINVDPTDGSLNLSQDNRIVQILNIVLNRFYMLTQSSLPNDFYNNPNDATGAYVDLYSKSEALNLATSMNNSGLSGNLKTFAQNYKGNIDGDNGFYSFLENNVSLYSFPENTVASIEDAYVDKTDSDYRGINIYTNAIEMQTPTENGDKPIDKFTENVQRGFFGRIFKGGRLPEASYLFTKENVLYIKDAYVKDNTVKEDKLDDFQGISLETRFLASENSIQNYGSYTSLKTNAINILLDKGNAGFITLGKYPPANASGLKKFENVVDTWVNQLSEKHQGVYNDNAIFNDIINMPSDLSAIVLLSNFGYSLGGFNQYPSRLGELIFQNPAAIDMPSYLPLYMGALVDADSNGNLEQLKNFFISGSGKNLSSSGLFIFADIHDINAYLSTKDKQELKVAYESFRDSQYLIIRSELENLYNDVQTAVTGGMDKDDAYESYLNPNTKNDANKGSYFTKILQPLLEKTTIIVFSQNAFKNVSTPNAYKSLKDVNATEPNKKAVNNRFFKQFFEYLDGELTAKQSEKKKEEEEAKKLSGDEDIITQTYYSFKNINDKWLCNPERTLKYGDGYPFNNPNKKLIDSFAFVDRAMNPVGDTVINPEILIDLFDDTNISVFSVLSQMLSMNGFEFFPLQNFMNHTKESWEDSFKIDPVGAVVRRSAFVCMYIGGSSSYPNDPNNGFKNDGITDISTTDAKDFNMDCIPIPEYDNQLERNSDFPYRRVRAFRVKFGQQNQSMFTDIKIDSKEYPETNESIQILARLAGDMGKNAPIPKGQNLYNLYENRAYKATVTGLGNAMIQPTQYFQLDNVPLYNGAYLILSVEHNITPNKMTTSFSGTKILKYPVPRVLNPAAAMGVEAGQSETTNPYSGSAGDIVTEGAKSISNPDKAKYNSMYEVNIQ